MLEQWGALSIAATLLAFPQPARRGPLMAGEGGVAPALPAIPAECPALPQSEPVEAVEPPAAPILPSRLLSPNEVAKRFLEWMRDNDFLGEYEAAGPNGLLEYYRWHCQDCGLVPHPQTQQWLAALKQLVPFEARQIGPREARKRISAYRIEPRHEVKPKRRRARRS